MKNFINIFLSMLIMVLFTAILLIYLRPKNIKPETQIKTTPEQIKADVNNAINFESKEIEKEILLQKEKADVKTEIKEDKLLPEKTKILVIGKEKFEIIFDKIQEEKFKIINGEFTAFGYIFKEDGINFITIDELNFNKIDLSKTSFDIYDATNKSLYDFFESKERYEIKISTLIIKEKRYKNITLNYTDNSLRISSEFLQVYVRKKSDFSGYIKLSNFPYTIDMFSGYPMTSELKNCDADIIFVSPIKEDFSAQFFGTFSDFKFKCKSSNLKNFNLKNSIKNIFELKNISYNATEKAIEGGIFDKSDYNSDISFQGQIDQGKLILKQFKASSLYGNISLTGGAEFLKRSFNINGSILLNFVSPELFMINYNNSGTIYKSKNEIKIPSQKMIQKYYLESNYQRTVNLLM